MTTGAAAQARSQAVPKVWPAAWRRHRVATGISLGVVVLLAVLVTVQMLVLPDCSWDHRPSSIAACYEFYDRVSWFPFVRVVLMVTPAVVGLLLGITVFAREFEGRAQVFWLTQHIGRLRWWATGVVVTGVPVTVALLVLGFGTGWAFDAHREQLDFYSGSHVMAWPQLDIVGVLPATSFLLAFALASTAGLVLRSTVIGLIVAGLLAGLVLIWSAEGRKDLVPHDVVSTPITESGSGFLMSWGDGAWYVDSYPVDAAGNRVEYPERCPEVDALMTQAPLVMDEAESERFNAEWERIQVDCHRRDGIVATESAYITAAQQGRMRWTLAGIHVALAGLVLLLGAINLRRRDLR